MFLSQALDLDRRGIEQYLSSELFSRTIGMFEQNNVGIRMRNPISDKIENLTEFDEKLSYFSDAVIKILQQLDRKCRSDVFLF